MNTDDYDGHTPGPWCLQWGPNETITGISELGGETIDGARDGHEPAATNTRLAAAAPDLLRRLIKAEELIDELGNQEYPHYYWDGEEYRFRYEGSDEE